MKTILVFLLSLTVALVLPNPTWAHGGGGGGGGSSSSAGGGGGSSSSAGGAGSSSSAGGGGGASSGGGNAWGMGHGAGRHGARAADPCTELGRAIDVLILAVRKSGRQIDQASNAKEAAGAINAFADAAEKLSKTTQRLRPQFKKMPTHKPKTCKEAYRRLEAFEPEINAVIEKLVYKQRRYSADSSVTNSWRRLLKITRE